MSEATDVEPTGVILMHKGWLAIRRFDRSFQSAMHRSTGLQCGNNGNLVATGRHLGERKVAIGRLSAPTPNFHEPKSCNRSFCRL